MLKNSDVLIKDIALQYNVSIIAIKDINQGHSYYDDDEKYPLRLTKRGTYNYHTVYYCIDCGKRVHNKNTRCIKCAQIKQRKVDRPTRTELKFLIRTIPFVQIGKQFGVTDNAIRKWCKSENLSYKKTEINKISDEDWEKI